MEHGGLEVLHGEELGLHMIRLLHILEDIDELISALLSYLTVEVAPPLLSFVQIPVRVLKVREEIVDDLAQLKVLLTVFFHAFFDEDLFFGLSKVGIKIEHKRVFVSRYLFNHAVKNQPHELLSDVLLVRDLLIALLSLLLSLHFV